MIVVEKIMILCIALFSYNGLLAGSGFGDVVRVRLKCRMRLLRRKLNTTLVTTKLRSFAQKLFCGINVFIFFLLRSCATWYDNG